MKLTKTGLKTEYPTHSNVNFLLLMKCILIKHVFKVTTINLEKHTLYIYITKFLMLSAYAQCHNNYERI